MRFFKRRFILLLLLPAALFGQSSDFASTRLEDLVEKEAKIYAKVAEDPEFYSEDDLNRRFNELLQLYSTYLINQPDDVEAYIFYGKLLRKLEQYDQAFTAFLKADELDPKIAVVKQQIGNQLTEEGKGKAALPFFLSAIDLEPETAVYHFSLGELLHGFRKEFLSEALFTQDALDREMLKAFGAAARLDPENFDYQLRLGEAYYELSSPDWKNALVHWNKLRKKAASSRQVEILELHRARTLGKLGRADEAVELLETVMNPALQASKQQVLDEITQL